MLCGHLFGKNLRPCFLFHTEIVRHFPWIIHYVVPFSCATREGGFFVWGMELSEPASPAGNTALARASSSGSCLCRYPEHS